MSDLWKLGWKIYWLIIAEWCEGRRRCTNQKNTPWQDCTCHWLTFSSSPTNSPSIWPYRTVGHVLLYNWLKADSTASLFRPKRVPMMTQKSVYGIPNDSINLKKDLDQILHELRKISKDRLSKFFLSTSTFFYWIHAGNWTLKSETVPFENFSFVSSSCSIYIGNRIVWTGIVFDVHCFLYCEKVLPNIAEKKSSVWDCLICENI